MPHKLNREMYVRETYAATADSEFMRAVATTAASVDGTGINSCVLRLEVVDPQDGPVCDAVFWKFSASEGPGVSGRGIGALTLQVHLNTSHKTAGVYMYYLYVSAHVLPICK